MHSKYENMRIWNLISYINKNNCKEMDQYLANKLNTDSLFSYYYSFRRLQDFSDMMPLTAEKINEIAIKSFKDKKIFFIKKFDYIIKWFSDDTKNIILDFWLNDKDYYFFSYWLYENALNNKKSTLLLKKLIELYNNKKSWRRLLRVHDTFQNIDLENLPIACEIVSNSTPAIIAGLINRSDIEDKYILKGLRALSKLNRQISVKTKVDFSLLEKLAPKSRLNVMKQLLSMLDYCHLINPPEELPFKIAPTKEDIEKFLFPCSFKYNKEVSEILKRFDRIVDISEKINSKNLKEVSYGYKGI